MTVGDPVNDRSAKARDHADNDADDRTPDAEPDIGEPVAHPVDPATAQLRILADGPVLSQESDV